MIAKCFNLSVGIPALWLAVALVSDVANATMQVRGCENAVIVTSGDNIVVRTPPPLVVCKPGST